MELSKRLFMTASMVERGSIVADVGCDHGYTAIYLVQNGICPRVLAMDVNEGPLAAAREHIREAGLTAYIETRLSDGLSAMKWTEAAAPSRAEPGRRPETAAPSGAGTCRRPEADTLLMAGIGGRLAARILQDGADKLACMQTVIVQPQSELWLVRQTLMRLGYRITAEDMVKEDGKFYTAIRAQRAACFRTCGEGGAEALKASEASKTPVASKAPEDSAMPEDLPLTREEWQEAGERWGHPLIEGRHPVLLEYLKDVLLKNRAAQEAIRTGAIRTGAICVGAIRMNAAENGSPEEIPERSRERLAQLEKEAFLAGRLVSWLEKGRTKW